MNSVAKLKMTHKKKLPAIKKRLAEFAGVWARQNQKEMFLELCFCILTPQSAARAAENAINSLVEADLMFDCQSEKMVQYLNRNRIRFSSTKAKRLIISGKQFQASENSHRVFNLSMFINPDNIPETRKWFAKNVNGFGYKESSHFLRNIGLGDDLAILDRHILKNMAHLGMIDEVPKTMTPKKYLEIEQKLRKFSQQHGIPLAHLDLLFWSHETGEIFK